MRTIIVDDERLAREEFKSMLKKHPQIEIVGEFKNTIEAEKGIKELQPDLMFIDIQMPGETGLEFLKRIDFAPRTIFVTAYDEYAIKAFELNAFDYLLKPLDPERLDDLVNRLEEENKTPESVENIDILKKGDKILVKDGEKVWFINIEEIRFFESDGNYVKVYFDKFHPLLLRSLNNLNDRIDPKLFFRANRKYLINLERIVKIDTWFNGGLHLELDCGTKIEISRRQAIKFKDMFSI
jgi:two-component system LytT family response regulator